MHLKLFLPIKQLAVRGFQWSYFVARLSHVPTFSIDELTWDWAKDMDDARNKGTAIANKWENRQTPNVLCDVVLVQYADTPEVYLPSVRIMNTPLFTLYSVLQCTEYLGAMIHDHFRIKPS